MATQLFYAAPSNATDALWRAWVQGLSDALTALGILKTGDAGQINIAASVAPTTINTAVGYEIRSLGDHKFKLWYCSGSTSTAPAIQLFVGTASDGSGGIINASESFFIAASASSSSIIASYVSGDETCLSINMFPGANTNLGISIGQRKDDNGNDNGTGVSVVGYSPGGGIRKQQTIPIASLGGRFPATAYTDYLTDAPLSGTGAYGTVKGVWPVKVAEGMSGNPDLGAIVYATPDFPGVQEIRTEIYGVEHVYMSSGLVCNARSNSNLALAWRYE